MGKDWTKYFTLDLFRAKSENSDAWRSQADHDTERSALGMREAVVAVANQRARVRPERNRSNSVPQVGVQDRWPRVARFSGFSKHL